MNLLPLGMRPRDPAVRSVTDDIAGAGDQQIMRVVAMVDAMTSRGVADDVIAPLRQRLTRLRPPRPLRFGRLMFYPLDPLIVAPANWRPGRQAIPRSAIMVLADQVRVTMAAEATEIAADLQGRTTADAALIATSGSAVWPAAARILADAKRPLTWEETGLGNANYRPLADVVTALLGQAVALGSLQAGIANGLMPLRPEPLAAILANFTRASRTVDLNTANPGNGLVMVIALILNLLPEAVSLLPQASTLAGRAAVRAATDQAADLLLQQLRLGEGSVARIEAGSLADAGDAAHRIATLLLHLDPKQAKPARREQLRDVRLRLHEGCQARFAFSLREELLGPLQHLGIKLTALEVAALEDAARGLRVLAIEGRTAGGGDAYDTLLNMATEAIRHRGMRDRLSLADQARLVEILAGADAALAMLDMSG